jgi:two-component system alkaline phosphatase synthesis response regulator PhoP
MEQTIFRSHPSNQQVVDRPQRKCRILVVEDDFEIAQMLRILFETKGYQVLIAPRGEKALELCRRQLPNVVLLDIILPGIDGYEVCRRLKSNQHTRNVPVIFLTKKDERADQIAGLGLGADDYITKPFDIAQLESSVERLIARV